MVWFSKSVLLSYKTFQLISKIPPYLSITSRDALRPISKYYWKWIEMKGNFQRVTTRTPHNCFHLLSHYFLSEIIRDRAKIFIFRIHDIKVFFFLFPLGEESIMFHSEILAALNLNRNEILSPGLKNIHTLKCSSGNFPIKLYLLRLL